MKTDQELSAEQLFWAVAFLIGGAIILIVGLARG